MAWLSSWSWESNEGQEKDTTSPVTLPCYFGIDDIVVGADGSTWLRLPADDPLLSPLREWVVIVSDFDKYYRVLLPATFTLKHATIDGLWGVDVGGASAAVCRYLIGPM
jgi:hypothetical protein